MSNLSRFNPFRKTQPGNPFGFADNFLDHFPWPTPGLWSEQRGIGLDVTDQGSSYHVEAEIPGVKKENISISVDGNQVSIGAEIKKEAEKTEGNTYLCNERYFGRVFRTFTLDHHIDEENVKASYSDGLLKLDLPKKAGASAKQITIS